MNIQQYCNTGCLLTCKKRSGKQLQNVQLSLQADHKLVPHLCPYSGIKMNEKLCKTGCKLRHLQSSYTTSPAIQLHYVTCNPATRHLQSSYTTSPAIQLHISCPKLNIKALLRNFQLVYELFAYPFGCILHRSVWLH